MTTTLERLQAALAGRYDISREIGAGGMATVFLAHDVKHDRDVAIKVLHPDLGAALGSERFLSEIKTTAKLQHPHILPLLDSGEADGLLYYVMPVVTGESLRVRIEREGQLSINESVRIAKETASALDYAHRHGVVHRDIKPENILLHDGQAIVGDFGIALAVSAAGGARMTQTGLSLGTPQYMSPEQAMGERTVDARSDVYSLGAVTYEMLTGDAPFTGNSVQAIVSKIMTQRPTPISATRDTVPETVENAVMIALSKLPADRFATAAEFANALTSSTTSFARPTAATGSVARTGPGGRRLDSIGQHFGIPAIAVALIASGLALWGWMRPQHPRQVVRYALTFDSTDALVGSHGRFRFPPTARLSRLPVAPVKEFSSDPVTRWTRLHFREPRAHSRHSSLPTESTSPTPPRSTSSRCFQPPAELRSPYRIRWWRAAREPGRATDSSTCRVELADPYIACAPSRAVRQRLLAHSIPSPTKPRMAPLMPCPTESTFSSTCCTRERKKPTRSLSAI
ncbi:MAG: serine/threonine protein kinase [Gemmatimonadaceae bacterium]|nr:serine/threonine protein kinase [Gemmatimonadaceae bacterium]